MQFGAVALVLVETIFRKLCAEVTHDPIARDFRDHARGGDGQTVTIAVNDCGLRKGEWKNRQPVDEHVLWRNCERSERDAHCLMRCAQNIDPIDLEMIDNADRPRDVAIRNQLIVNFVATFRRKLFRIVQLSMFEFFRQHNRGGDDWPR